MFLEHLHESHAYEAISYVFYRCIGKSLCLCCVFFLSIYIFFSSTSRAPHTCHINILIMQKWCAVMFQCHIHRLTHPASSLYVNIWSNVEQAPEYKTENRYRIRCDVCYTVYCTIQLHLVTSMHIKKRCCIAKDIGERLYRILLLSISMLQRKFSLTLEVRCGSVKLCVVL